MVEGTALEMRHTRKGIVGSNPTLSANMPDFFSAVASTSSVLLGVRRIALDLSNCLFC